MSLQNPLAPLFNTARQLNEQVNLSARSLGDSLTQSTNAILAAAGAGIPGAPGAAPGAAGALQLPFLPPLPGVAANPGGSSHNTHRSNGNPNGIAGVPSLQNLFPAGTVQAFTQVDDVIFPRGFPSPARVLFGGVTPAPAPAAAPAPIEQTVARRGSIGVEGTQRGVAARRSSRAIGVAAT